MTKNKDHLMERDQDILLFLWRWKLVSSAALIFRFFPDCKATSAYSKLLKLRRKKYIKTQNISLREKGAALSLTDKGFKFVKSALPELEKEAYKSDKVNHDFLCSAVHIGAWLDGAPDCGEVFSEQELKTYHKDFYPKWLPHLDSHRPDGHWYFDNSQKPEIISLEVEITPKKVARYTKVKDFYDYFDIISNVIWVAADKPMAKRILKYLTLEGQFENKKHNFVLKNDILKKNWSSPIILGPNSNLTIYEFMQERSKRNGVGKDLVPSDPLLVDTRLYSVNSDDYTSRHSSKIIY